MPADGYLNFNTRIDTDGFQKGIKNVQSSARGVENAFGKLGSKIKIAFSVTAIAAFTKKTIESAAEVRALGSQFSQTFGEMSDAAKKAIANVANPAGILGTRLEGVAAQIYAFAKTAKMETSEAMSFMGDALQVAADSAAYYDRSLEDTSETLRSFLKGNYANDAALGLSATEATRNAKAMELYGKKFIYLTEAQKQLALLEMVKDANKLSGAYGQAAREAEGWENVTGNLSEAWNRLMAAVGQPLLKLAVPVVQQMTDALSHMTEWANNAYVALAKLFGWQEQQTGEVKATTAAQDGLTEAIEKTEAAQEGALAGFDEIEVLASKSEGAASSGSADSPVNQNSDQPPTSEGLEEIPKILMFLDDVIEKIKEISDLFVSGFWNGFGEQDFSKLLNGLERIKSSLSKIFDNISPNIGGFINAYAENFGQMAGALTSIGTTIGTNLISGLSLYLEENKDFISDRICGIFDASSTLVEHVGNLWSAFAEIFSVFADENGTALTSTLVEIFANGFLAVGELAAKLGADLIGLISQPIVDNQENLKSVLDDLLGFFNDVFTPIGELVTGLGEKFNALYDDYIAPTIETITEVISEWVNTFTEAYNTYLAPALDSFAEKFTEVVEEYVSPMFEKIIGFIERCAEHLKWWWDEILRPFGNWFIEHFVKNFSGVLEFIGSRVNAVIQFLAETVGNIMDVLNGLIDFITGIFTEDWELAWEGLKTVFKGIVNEIIGVFEGMVNGIIDSINLFVSRLNLVVGAAGDIFGEDWSIPKISRISIPRLAEGAVIPPNREFLAVLGDQKQGTNIETPLETMIEAFRTAMHEGGGTKKQTIVLMLNKRELGRAVVEVGNEEEHRIGLKAVTI